MDWSFCSAVDKNPAKLGGVWCFRGTRLPVASLFVVWHAFALVVSPFPPSYLSGSVHAVIFPYLSVLYLDTDWNFFAPTPAPGRFVRYVVETRDGSSHAFRLTEDRRPGPSAMRLRKVYDGIHPDRPEHYASVGRFLSAGTPASSR